MARTKGTARKTTGGRIPRKTTKQPYRYAIVEGTKYDIYQDIALNWDIFKTTSKTINIPLTTEQFMNWKKLADAVNTENFSKSISYADALQVVDVMKPVGDLKWILYTYLTREDNDMHGIDMQQRMMWYNDVGYIIRAEDVKLPYNTQEIPDTGEAVPPFYANFGLSHDPIYSLVGDEKEEFLSRSINQLTGIVHNAFVKSQSTTYIKLKLPTIPEFIEFPTNLINWNDLVTIPTPRIFVNHYNLNRDAMITVMRRVDNLQFTTSVRQIASRKITSDTSLQERNDILLARSVVPSFSDEAFAGSMYNYNLIRFYKYSWNFISPRELFIGIVVNPKEKKRYSNIDNFQFTYTAMLDSIVNANISTQQKLDYLGLNYLIGRKEGIIIEGEEIVGTSPYIISPSLLVYDVNTTYLSDIKQALLIIGMENMYVLTEFLANIAEQENDKRALTIASKMYEVLE